MKVEPLNDFIVYHSPEYKPASTDFLQQQLFRYYQSKYEKQEGILPTPLSEYQGSSTYQDIQPYDHKVLKRNQEPLEQYRENHKLWTPQFGHDLFPVGTYRDSDHVHNGPEFDTFINYVHMPKMVGKEPIPSFVHHTACSLGEFVYILGGARKFSNDRNVQFVDTDVFTINNSKTLPFPLDNHILNHPTMIPNDNLYIINTESNSVHAVGVSGDVPPPLYCMSASEITQRHIFYYGGFQYVDKITKTNEGNFIIDRDVLLNNSGYILDTTSLKFKKFELVAHPTILTKQPITVPRFGHTSNSLNIHKCLHDTDLVIPATVFIMGGYKKNQEGKFETIADLWKVEFSTTYRGKHNYLEFGETILATPINNNLTIELVVPKARAFHIAEIIDLDYTFGENKQPQPTETNNHKVGIARPSSPDSTNAYNLDENRKLKKRLIIHGGTFDDDILGDTWWFDFDEEVWSHVDTFFPLYERKDRNELFFKNELFQCDVKTVGHKSMIIDRYLMLFLGAQPSAFIHQKDRFSDVPDISRLMFETALSNENELYNRMFCLNLVTQTWVLIKCYHNFQATADRNERGAVLGCLGCIIVGSNSKVVFCGGYLKADLNEAPGKDNIRLLSSNMCVFEFPMGMSTNDGIRKI